MLSKLTRRWELISLILFKNLTQFSSHVVVFVHEVIDPHLKLVDVFGHGLGLAISHFNLIFTLFDLRYGSFQAVSAL